MRAVTGRPIKLIGLGEKLDALDTFHPDRIAGRILGMGDVVSLVEKAVETVEKDEAEKIARKVQKGEFDFDDMAAQLKQLRKMGGLSGVMGMLPGVGKIKQQLANAKVDDKVVKRQEAIISSMTRAERRNVKLLNGSRRRRIATGSGTSVEDVNRLVKQFMEMSRMVKQVSKLGQKGMMRSGGLGSLFRR
jgi:signal recognition particle subunit SRP54